MPSPAFRSYVERILDRGARAPDEVVVATTTEALTAREFAERVHGLAGALAEQGLGPGRRLAIVATISAEALATRYAANLIGCATVYCPNTGSAQRLANFVDHVEADAVVAFPETVAATRLVFAAASAPALLSIGPVAGAVDLLAVAGRAAAVNRRPAAGDLAVLVASGGTTGESKASRRSFEAYGRMIEGPPASERRQLVCTAFAYIAQVLIDQTLLGGGTVVLRERFDPLEVLAAIETEQITHLGLVEPLLVELIDHPDLDRYDRSSLVAISHIGAAAAPNLRRRLLERAGPVLAHPYGASEAGLVSVLAGAEYQLARPELLGTAGRALPGVEIRIERADGTGADPGETGLIAVRSAGIADGYSAPSWQEQWRARYRHGWYYTGDLGLLDADGYLHVRGRSGDAREIGGRTVLPVDLQDALCGHPDVRYAVAVPLDPPGAGFLAMVLPAPGATITAAELTAIVTDQLGGGLAPEAIVFADRVPVTEQGKPDRTSIKAQLTESVRRSSAR